MSFYGGLRSTSDRLVKGKGQAMTLTSRSAGAYDTSTGSAAVSESSSQVWGVALDYPLKQIDGTQIKRGDIKVMLSAVLTTVPSPGDGLLIGAVMHEVVDVRAVSPAGTPVLYTLQVRSGG